MTTDTVAILTAVGTAIRDELRRQGALDETSIDPTRVALKPGASADLLELAEAAVKVMRPARERDCFDDIFVKAAQLAAGETITVDDIVAFDENGHLRKFVKGRDTQAWRFPAATSIDHHNVSWPACDGLISVTA